MYNKAGKDARFALGAKLERDDWHMYWYSLPAAPAANIQVPSKFQRAPDIKEAECNRHMMQEHTELGGWVARVMFW